MEIILLYCLGVVWIVLALIVKNTVLMGIFVIISIICFVWANHIKKSDAKKRDDECKRVSEEELAKIAHTQCFLSTDYLSALLINEQTKLFYIANREYNNPEFEVKKFTFNQILEAAVEENGSVLALLPKDGLIGSLLPNGEIIDGADSDEDETVEKLSLKIVVDNLLEPIVEYVFMENNQSITKDSEEYEKVFTQCNEWYQKISVIIRRHERVPVRQWR